MASSAVKKTSSISVMLALAALVAGLTSQRDCERLRPGHLYDVPVDGHTATFELPPRDASTQYLVVVANLDQELKPRQVQLQAGLANQDWVPPLREVAPLAARQIACEIPTGCSADNTCLTEPEHQRVFWLQVAKGSPQNPACYRDIHAELVSEGEYVRVYVDEEDNVTPETIAEVVRLCDVSVFPNTVRFLGMPHDVDGDGKFAILLTSWLGRLEDGTVSLGGMVSPSDFRMDYPVPYSNRTDVLYLNADVRPGHHLETLLAHELAHAVTVSGRQLAGSTLFAASDEEAWLSEAIAHVAENLQSDNWSNLDYRVARYLSQPGETPLVVPSYAAANLWRAPAPRGSTYLFLRWCVQRYGVGLLPRLIYSPRPGTSNLEAATHESFARLYRQFAVDLFLASSVCPADSANEEPVAGQLPPVSLCHRLGRWSLAGPRVDLVEVSENASETPWQSELTGTSARHVILTAPAGIARRITVTADPGTRLQVTVVPLDPERAELRVKLEPDGDSLRLAVRQTHGCDVRLSHVNWEAAEEDSPASTAHRRHCQVLEDEELEVFFGETDLAPGEELISRTILPAKLPTGPVSVRVVGIDAQGRYITAWATAQIGPQVQRVARAAN